MESTDKIPTLESGIISENEILGVLTPELNCCVEKVIGEMGPLLKKHGMSIALNLDKDPRALIAYNPKWLMLLRSGCKPLTPPDQLGILEGHIPYYRSMDIPTYYYIDDALFYMNQNAPLKFAFSSDYTIVATDALAEHLIVDQKYPKPVYMLKTHMNLPIFDACARASYLIDENKFNILFTSQGRIGANHLYQIVERMNQNPDKYKDVSIIVVSHQVAQMRSIINEFRHIRKRYWEFMPLMELYGLCKASQLILAPAHIDDLLYTMSDPRYRRFWLNSKSCVKYNFAGAASIPCISSPIQEYKQAIKHEETGFIANEVDEWIHYIDLILEDSELREKIGQAARKDVEDNWHIEKRVKEFCGIFRGEETCLIQK